MRCSKKTDGNRRPEFWVAAVAPADSDVTSACLSIARAVEARAVSREYCDRIFMLSRFWLPDVRGNYFWPAFHREVASRCTNLVAVPSEQALTRFSRLQLDLEYSHELEMIRAESTSHCYLELIFSQAGIGKDRDHFIRSFLKFLAEYKKSQSGTPEERARAGLSSFLASLEPRLREDAGPLRTVLLRIGIEVLSLVEALRQHADRGQLVFGDWKELRELWLRFSDSDLDTLTPSAASVIHEFIPHFADTWTRAEIFRHTRAEGAECEWPDGTRASRCNDVRTLPLGSANLHFRTMRFPITVIDRPDQQIWYLNSVERDTWHSLEDGYNFMTSSRPFEPHGAGGCRSVPIFERYSDRAGVANLHFWSGRLHPRISVDRHSPSTPGRRENLHARVNWRWRNNEIVLLIDRINAPLPDGPNYRLKAGGTLLWEGNMRGGRPACPRPLMVKASALPLESIVEISLEAAAGGKSSIMLNAWPLTAPHFLVANGRVCDADRSVEMHASRPETCKINLITRNPHELLKLQGLRELGREDFSTSVAQLTQIALQLTGWEGEIQYASRRWNVTVRPTIALNYPADLEVRKGGVSYTGTGNIHVSYSMDDVTLTTDSELPQDGTFGFWIETEAETLFCPLSAQYLKRSGDAFLLQVGALVRNRMSGQEWGFIVVTAARAGTPPASEELRRTFYVPPEKPISPAVAMGERPTLLTNMPDSFFEFAVPAGESNVGSVGQGRLLGNDWELTARWIPSIFDLVIRGEPTLAGERVLDVLKLSECQQIPATAMIPDGEDASIECGNTAIRVGSRQEVDLLPVIRDALKMHSNSEMHFIGSGGKRLIWRLELRTSVGGVTARVVSEACGMQRIHLNAHGRASKSQEILARLLAGKHVLEARQFRIQPGHDFNWITSLDLCTDRRRTDTLAVDLEINGQVFGPFEVEPNVGQNLSDAVKSKFLPTLKSLVNDFSASNDARYLSRIFFAVFGESLLTGSVPPVAFRVAQSITRSSDRDPQLEQALVMAIEYLGALFDGRRVNIIQGSSAESEPIGMIRDSVWLLLAKRQERNGELNPAQLIPIMDRVANKLAPGEIHDARIRGLAEFAVVSAAQALTRAGHPCPVSVPCLNEEARSIEEAFAMLNNNPL